MRLIFSSLVAASLLIHALLGCCCDHAHDTSGCDQLPLASATDCDCGHQHGDSANEHGSNGPCKGHSHCRGLCNYLPTQKTQNGKLHSLAPLCELAICNPTRNSRFVDLGCVAQ